MKSIFINLFLTFIGTILLYLLFFPINYKFNKEKYFRLPIKEIKDVFDTFNLSYDPKYYTKTSDSDVCFIVFPIRSYSANAITLDCAFYFKNEHFIDFYQTLNFLNVFYYYFKNLHPKIGIISENEYNSLSLFLGAYHPDIHILILLGELFPSNFLKIYELIQPRLCFHNVNICTMHQFTRYIHRTEFYENITVPLIWVINFKDILNHQNTHFKRSLEIFHQIGSKTFTKKWIIKDSEFDLKKLDQKVYFTGY